VKNPVATRLKTTHLVATIPLREIPLPLPLQGFLLPLREIPLPLQGFLLPLQATIRLAMTTRLAMTLQPSPLPPSPLLNPKTILLVMIHLDKPFG
jgi:hypothetical protein